MPLSQDLPLYWRQFLRDEPRQLVGYALDVLSFLVQDELVELQNGVSLLRIFSPCLQFPKFWLFLGENIELMEYDLDRHRHISHIQCNPLSFVFGHSRDLPHVNTNTSVVALNAQGKHQNRLNNECKIVQSLEHHIQSDQVQANSLLFWSLGHSNQAPSVPS